MALLGLNFERRETTTVLVTLELPPLLAARLASGGSRIGMVSQRPGCKVFAREVRGGIRQQRPDKLFFPTGAIKPS